MLNGGGHCNRLQSKVTYNRDFTETVALPASFNLLTEAGVLGFLPPLIVLKKIKSPGEPTIEPTAVASTLLHLARDSLPWPDVDPPSPDRAPRWLDLDPSSPDLDPPSPEKDRAAADLHRGERDE